MSPKEALQKIKEIVEFYDDYEEPVEDFDPCGWSGGNFDDCYALGVDDGNKGVAQEIKDVLKEIVEDSSSDN